MHVPHLLTEVVNRPLKVTPLKLQVLMSIFDKRSGNPFNLDLSALSHMNSATGGEVKAEARPVNEIDSSYVAVITTRGSLVARNHGFDDASGMRSYRTLQYEID